MVEDVYAERAWWMLAKASEVKEAKRSNNNTTSGGGQEICGCEHNNLLMAEVEVDSGTYYR